MLHTSALAGVALAVSKRCKHCFQFRLPSEIVFGNENSGYLCTACYYRHHENLRQLAEGRPRACNECGISFDGLKERGMVDVMKLHVKDGILQLLCLKCSRPYEEKSHVYKGTAFERLAKIR